MGQKRVGASPQYLGPDDQENVRLVTSSTGTVLDHNNYKAFLDMLNTPTQVNPFLAAGNVAYRQEVLSLLRAGARLYDPVTGRWISMDPIGFYGHDTSLFRYAFNNPTSGVDPTGLLCKAKVLAFLQVFVGCEVTAIVSDPKCAKAAAGFVTCMAACVEDCDWLLELPEAWAECLLDCPGICAGRVVIPCGCAAGRGIAGCLAGAAATVPLVTC
jgi:RHS repeat-associated protein